jgi:hypothetical protein
LDYFPFDVDFFNDEKIGAISGEFGIKGELACIKLLCAIYRQGYFILWNEMLQMKLIKELPGVSADLLNGIVSRAVRWGFFDKDLFDKSGILTSKAIQRRYFEIVKRRIASEVDLPYLLVNVCSNPVSACRNTTSKGVNVNINAQSKVNKSKVNKKENSDFEKVWEMYGKKGNKKTCANKWANLKNHCREAALAHIPLYVAATPEKQFRKNFETYLNQEVWNDELPVQKMAAAEMETREIANEEYRLNRHRLTPRLCKTLLQRVIDEVPAQTAKENFNRAFDRIVKKWKNDELD